MNIRTIQKISLAFGLIYLAVGVLGFIPGITVPADQPGHGLILGIFEVNTIHNLVHLLAGLGLVAAGLNSTLTRPVNRLLAPVFGLLVPLGLIPAIADLFALNAADHILHLGTALLTAYLGFSAVREEETAGYRA